MKLFNKHKPAPHPRKDPKYDGKISSAAVQGIFSNCEDFACRRVFVGGNAKLQAYVCYFDGIVANATVSENVVRPLTERDRFTDVTSAKECIELIERGAVYSVAVKPAATLDELCAAIVNGFCAIVFDGEKRAVCFEVRNPASRSIEQPTTEKSMKGAKDAFVEVLRLNTTLVRRKLRDPALKLRQTVIGRKSVTNVGVFYYDGVADPGRVDELMRRLDAIDIQGMLTTACLEEYIISRPRSPFPQLVHTERPDLFAESLLEGRIGILVDGLPIGFLLPATFFRLMHVPDDGAQHFAVATALTVLRYISLLLAVLLPGFIVAIEMYHQEMLPTKLLISIIQAKQQVPFGVSIEVLSMLIAFELLQEAGLRLPSSIGQTVSIIGALIVGQSAVSANVISPIAVIVVALSGICGFTIPSQDLGTAVRLCRFVMVIFSILAGMYGLMAGVTMLVYHLATIDSYGVDYLSPVSDRSLPTALHTVLRPPLHHRKFRDPSLNTPDKRKQA